MGYEIDQTPLPQKGDLSIVLDGSAAVPPLDAQAQITKQGTVIQKVGEVPP
jgi:hypothetical protein